MSELRALRIEVDRLRSRLAQEAAYRTELEAALVNLTGNIGHHAPDELLPDAFERFFNADDPQHAVDRSFLLR